MKNSKGVSLIALIITIIVIIILAAIVMNASSSTIENAQFAQFSQEFGEYSDQVKLDAANVRQKTALAGQNINNRQQYYMVANGWSVVGDSGDGYGIAKMTMPVGYVLTNSQEATYRLQEILGIGMSGDECKTPDAEVAYVIRDSKISYSANAGEESDGSAAREFYGDSNGTEYHFITSDGQVFTLPGYPVTQTDGTIEYHIDTKAGHFYVVKGNSTLGVGENNAEGHKITHEKPILASYLTTTHGIEAIGGTEVTTIAAKSRTTSSDNL
jgi:Tfp pilus assembly protein FimT